MYISLEALQIMDAIARNGSFAAAAQELDRVPSALTYSVRKLEEDLDVLLFDRAGYRARLTPAGEELLEQGRHLLCAAGELERRVQRTARGFEVELRLVLDNAVEFATLLPLIAEFDASMPGTRLRFSFEVLTGAWEALLEGRADMILGAAAGGPELIRLSGNFQTRSVATLDWVFAVAPQHPLAQVAEPLQAEQLRQHRIVAVGDSGRSLPAANFGLLIGQETLTVANMHDKLQAQLAGLGCGHLPRGLVTPYLASGALVEKATNQIKPPDTLHLAWRKNGLGKAGQWWQQKLSDPTTLAILLQVPV